MLVHVRYPDRKGDYVNSLTFDRLIRDRAIAAFFRPSEQQWIDIRYGPLRTNNPARYTGVEMRAVNPKEGFR
jgi:hypothetical protein